MGSFVLLRLFLASLLAAPILAQDTHTNHLEDEACRDLFKLTCSPTNLDDGSGSESTLTDNVALRVSQVQQETKSYFAEQFLSALEKPENEYFSKLSSSVLDLPSCVGTDKACIGQLAQGLGVLAAKRIFPAHAGAPAPVMELDFLYRPYESNYKNLNFLLQNSVYQNIERNLSNYARLQMIDPKVLQKLESEILPNVKRLLIKIIQENVVEEKVRGYMVSRVNSIVFGGINCSESFFVSPETIGPSLAPILVTNANYDPVKNTFKYCGGYLLQYPSEFSIVQTVAHELGHSIDPCYIATGNENSIFKYSNPKDVARSKKEYPLSGLIGCLPSKKPFFAAFRSKSTKDFKKSPFCALNQIGEAVADWLAAEILPRYLESYSIKRTPSQYRNGYATIFRSIEGCDEHPPHRGFDVHPGLEARVNKLLLVNPEIRQQMGCSVPHPGYCKIHKPDSK